MRKTILITGSTDGIGLETAKTLASQGHHVLLHGRSKRKLDQAEKALSEISDSARVETYLADLSSMAAVVALAEAVIEKHDKLDVLINNAGVYKIDDPITRDGLDARFAVNTIAPALLTQKLLPLLGADARVISLSSAAQAPVNPQALLGKIKMQDTSDAYAQSKLALTMWSQAMALAMKDSGPVFISVNPGSLLATNMVKEGFGIPGSDIQIGDSILLRLALNEEFASKSGQYFDNDMGAFNRPHVDALDSQKCEQVVKAIESVLADVAR